MQNLRADAVEYTPSWQKRSSAVAVTAPIPTTLPARATLPTPKTGFTTSMTSTNTITTHSGFSAQATTPQSPSCPPQGQQQQTVVPPPTRSPVSTHVIPTRMSPVHAPSAAFHMSPNAVSYVPRGAAAGSLMPLPTSTADLAVEKELQRKQQSGSPSTSSWVTTCTKSNGVRSATSPVPKAGSTPIVAEISVDKTDEEVLEISRCSSLKASAPAFLPRRTLNRSNMTKPSPFTLTPDSGDMRFGDPWCLFYLPVGGPDSTRESTYDPTLVFRMDCISSFWKVFNNIPEPTRMCAGTLYLFRDGINPKWEDLRNRDGGIVRAKVRPQVVDDAWLHLLCRTVGESWSRSVRNSVNGIALKVRAAAFMLEVWVTEQTSELMSDISELLHKFLGDAFQVPYIPHSVAQERAATNAAALAVKEKKNRGNRRLW